MGGIVLGMPGPWAEDCREKSDHYTTKIGGLPDWPIPEMGIDPHLLKCGFCGERLCLVAQVYAPVSLPELMIEERVIYILGCSMPKCGRDTCSWRVLRVQKCNVEVQPGSNSPKALSSEENSAPISKITNLWEVDLSTNGSEELDDDSDSDVDLQDLCKALSEAASLASRSKKQNFTKHSKGSGKGLVTKLRVTDVAIPVLITVMPCFYIYSQKEPSSGDMVAICANSASHSKKEDHGPSPEQEDEEKYEVETYEYDSALSADRTYLKFKKQIDAYPEQCFRYSYGGNPLLATANLVKPEICRLCGSLLHYEMQLMPPLLYFLLNAADISSTYSPEEWNWMTLIVYTCSKSCCPSQCKEETGGSCCWAVAEEVIIIQDEGMQGGATCLSMTRGAFGLIETKSYLREEKPNQLLLSLMRVGPSQISFLWLMGLTLVCRILCCGMKKRRSIGGPRS